MEFSYSCKELDTPDEGRRNTFLLANGLGGYASLSSVFSAPRCDQGVLVAAVTAPSERINMVHRLSERLTAGVREYYLSSQGFADAAPAEDGQQHIKNYTVDRCPTWIYEIDDISVSRQCAVQPGRNTAAVLYSVRNGSNEACTLTVRPFFKFSPKDEPVNQPKELIFANNSVSCGKYRANIRTNGNIIEEQPCWQTLAYPEDAKDGRPGQSLSGGCCAINLTVQPGESIELGITFSTHVDAPAAKQVIDEYKQRMAALEAACPLTDPSARALALAADAFITRRDSTDGKTIIAGYPLFSDWGRDTMIALPGCTLSTGRFDDAKSILRTFLEYEKDGLVPNLFPEGGNAPMYNTVDAALLLIDCVWQYHQRSGDGAFVTEAWPVMQRIVENYKRGTHHAIGMDSDGLIFAGQGLDQVTWMDVCINGVLPTPRHGKPVEINAYWYNALMIMSRLAHLAGRSGEEYAQLADRVKKSFIDKFYIEEKGYLRDVISGTEADEQIRCNQIWALSMPFTMLTHEQEARVLDTVGRHLLTPRGLRTLSPEDRQYHPHYGGPQYDRDMAYHQGTTWVFPMGAYWRAYLKVNGMTTAAAKYVRHSLEEINAMLHEGCAGQLPEIYDGSTPKEGKGCFAQAWSVGEMLRVYEMLEGIERREQTDNAQ